MPRKSAGQVPEPAENRSSERGVNAVKAIERVGNGQRARRPADAAGRPRKAGDRLCRGGRRSLGSAGMAHNPQAPQGPQGPQDVDPAGSTQMFQAFVNDGPTAGPSSTGAGPAAPYSPNSPHAPVSSGPSLGLIVGGVVGVIALAVVAWLLLG
ncbi:hypothetical protein GCM10022227_43970 [Streptomyces sedi]